MLRAFVKGAMLFGFGRIPGGTRFYRELTRNWMGTQGTHVDKLCRVWPGYVELWRLRCGLDLEGADIWVHEGGWTPFAPLVNYLVTGKGGALTNSEGRVLDRYLARAVNGALATALSSHLVPEERRRAIEPLRWSPHASEALEAVGGREYAVHDPGEIPLPSASFDLCHSGGALEHCRPEALQRFLTECCRVLRPGGIASHVLDHRDHLYHADKRYPFLAHLSLPDPLYNMLSGHALGYHNRLLPGEITSLFESAGFERIAVRTMILPDHRYVEGQDIPEIAAGQLGLPRRRLARRFRAATEGDLRTAAAHYLYRKPCG